MISQPLPHSVPTIKEIRETVNLIINFHLIVRELPRVSVLLTHLPQDVVE